MRNLISFSLVALQVLFLWFGLYPEFMLTFLVGAGFSAMGRKSFVNAACVTTCELNDLTSSDDCNTRGGIRLAFWAKYSDIDWEAMAAAPLIFNPTTQLILDYTMVGGAVFKKLEFERKAANYNFTYTSDTDLYTQVIATIFEGKDSANRNAIVEAIGCCKLILHIVDNNCQERVVGVEWDGTSFSPQITPLRITRHLDTSGVLGTDKGRDEIDFGGESLIAPLYSTAYANDNIPQ